MPDLSTLRQLVADVGPDTAQKLLDIFVEGSAEHLAAVRDYFDKGGDLGELRRHAHSLKGLCITYGAIDGAKAAETLQDACDTEDTAQIQACGKTALNIIPQDIKDTLDAFKAL